MSDRVHWMLFPHFDIVVTVDSVADHVVDPADPTDLVDLVVDLTHPADLPVDPVLRLAEALSFTISVLCAVECLDDCNLCLGSSDSFVSMLLASMLWICGQLCCRFSCRSIMPCRFACRSDVCVACRFD